MWAIQCSDELKGAIAMVTSSKNHWNLLITHDLSYVLLSLWFTALVMSAAALSRLSRSASHLRHSPCVFDWCSSIFSHPPHPRLNCLAASQTSSLVICTESVSPHLHTVITLVFSHILTYPQRPSPDSKNVTSEWNEKWRKFRVVTRCSGQKQERIRWAEASKCTKSVSFSYQVTALWT